MSSTIDVMFGVFLGYMIGVIKEKMKWIEKYISRKRTDSDEEIEE